MHANAATATAPRIVASFGYLPQPQAEWYMESAALLCRLLQAAALEARAESRSRLNERRETDSRAAPRPRGHDMRQPASIQATSLLARKSVASKASIR